MEQTTKKLKYMIMHQELQLKKYSSNVNSVYIKNSRAALDLAVQLIDIETVEIFESFYAMFLNRRNAVISIAKISQGGTSGTVVDAKIIFNHAILCGASGIVLMHNHPSGNNKPSEADIQLTRKLKEGALQLDLAIIDHLIICPTSNMVTEPGTGFNFFSFADEGLL